MTALVIIFFLCLVALCRLSAKSGYKYGLITFLNLFSMSCSKVPNIHLNILISFISNLFSSFFVVAHHVSHHRSVLACFKMSKKLNSKNMFKFKIYSFLFVFLLSGFIIILSKNRDKFHFILTLPMHYNFYL